MTHFSEATAQGDRPEQQDRYAVADINGGRFMALMDGHGGVKVAERLAKTVTEVFERALRRSLNQAHKALQETVSELHHQTKREKSGSTLSMVYLPENHLTAHVAVIGDSPVIIRTAEKSLSISPLHNARSNSVEREAALRRGARYIEPYLEDPQVPGYGLQLSRALGDASLSRILDRQPDVYSLQINQESFVLLASDGVLDGADIDTDRQLQRIATQLTDGFDAGRVVADALERRTGDNVTAIVWRAGRGGKIGKL